MGSLPGFLADKSYDFRLKKITLVPLSPWTSHF